MPIPTSSRRVQLLDGRLPTRPFVPAELLRDYPVAAMVAAETAWASARRLVAAEHAHWDWRNKAAGVSGGRFVLVAVECESDPQGLMAVERLPQRGACGESVVYVDYLETAHWNVRGAGADARFLGIGTVLIADAVRLSTEEGLRGRVGLHSLPQAERFYANLGMTDHGSDPYYFDLRYFEFAGPIAEQWLASLGG